MKLLEKYEIELVLGGAACECHLASGETTDVSSQVTPRLRARYCGETCCAVINRSYNKVDSWSFDGEDNFGQHVEVVHAPCPPRCNIL